MQSLSLQDEKIFFVWIQTASRTPLALVIGPAVTFFQPWKYLLI